MKSRDDILLMLRQQKAVLSQRYPIHRLALFGSWAREEQTPDSDIDILVDVSPSIGWKFVSLAEELEQLLGLKVDLVSSRAIRPALWKEIESEIIDA